MNKKDILSLLEDRHTTNKQRINAYKVYKNIDGTDISKGHASTALCTTRKEQLTIELIIEIVKQLSTNEVPLSEKAKQGLYKIAEPQERHFKNNQYGGRRPSIENQLKEGI